MNKILFSLDIKSAKKYSYLVKKNKLRRIYQGIYSENLNDPLEKIVKHHWMKIVAYLAPNAILSFRTAIDLKPTFLGPRQEVVFITSSYTKNINLPGLIIKVYKGEYQQYSEQVIPELKRSNIPRMLLENLTVVKSHQMKGIKTIGVIGVERFLARELQYRGENRLNEIRDEAKEIALRLEYMNEYKKLSQIISTLLSSHEDSDLQSPHAKSVVKIETYDENRLQLFEKLSLYLQKCHFKERSYVFSKNSFRNLSFFESYFSNYIEGTEFIIEEAEDIVFKGIEINHRHADSHDILANFHLTNDFDEMNRTPNNAAELLNILRLRHAYLMKERPEVRPGKFKDKPNKAGNTYFVTPENVIGTLTQGFEIYQILKKGLPRALFMHFLISEVHPFNDGNGRLSRIMLNAELVHAATFKIIVPTVYRDNYLGALRRATRDHHFYSYCKVLDQLQAYTEIVPWLNYGEARTKIENDNANMTPDEGLPIFNRVIRTLMLSNFESE